MRDTGYGMLDIGYKDINVQNTERRRIEAQLNVVTIVLTIAALVLAIVSLLAADRQVAGLLRWISFGLMLALLLFRVFIGRFGSKPTREEVEEQVFGKKN